VTGPRPLVQQAHRGVVPVLLQLLQSAGQPVLRIVAGMKRPAGAGYDEHPYLVVGEGLLGSGLHLAAHQVVVRVHHRGPVKREDPNAVALVQ
jgi:hypothetical protein